MPSTRVLSTDTIKAQNDGNIVGNGTNLNDGSDATLVYRNDLGVTSRQKTWVMDSLKTSGAGAIKAVKQSRTWYRIQYATSQEDIAHIRYETAFETLRANNPTPASWTTTSAITSTVPENSSAWDEIVADSHGYGISGSNVTTSDGGQQQCSEQHVYYDWESDDDGFGLWVQNWIGFVPILTSFEQVRAVAEAMLPRHIVFEHELPALYRGLRNHKQKSFCWMGLPGVVRRRGIYRVSEDVWKFYLTKRMKDMSWFSMHSTSVRDDEVRRALAEQRRLGFAL